MRLKLLSTFDSEARVYLAPFVARSEVEAIRQVRASLADPQMKDTPILTHPEHFSVVELGEFDDDTGVITPCVPNTIARIVHLLPSSTVPS